MSQLRNEEEKPIAYCSRQLNLAETNYSVTELELLAFLFATKQFRCYLYGRRFTVYTDHRALKWLSNLQDPSSRLTRWAVKLSEYDYIVEHRPGTKMRHADALSRSVHWIEKDVNLSRDVIKEEQDKDSLCLKYKHYENFWTDEDGCYIIRRVKDNLAFLFKRFGFYCTYYHELTLYCTSRNTSDCRINR